LFKRILLTLLQFIVFAALLAVGAFWALVRIFCPPLAFIPVWRFHISATHDFVANGLVFALALLAILVLIEALRKALKPWAALTVLAFVLAIAVSFLTKLGLLTVSR